VNDRVDVAAAAGADGVHLGQDDLSAVHARCLIGGDRLIGLSTHAGSELEASSELPVDYIAVGPIYETPTKPGRAATGLDLVKFAREHCKRPFFAIGGIDLTTLPDVVAAGAGRVCVLRALTQAEDPVSVARRIKSLLI
jgi:thiamine-phosphate pyrophosphorylase